MYTVYCVRINVFLNHYDSTPPAVYTSGPPCSAGSQQLLLPGPVQRWGEELGGGATPGRAAPELPADPGLLLHGAPQHECWRPVSAHVHRRLPPDPTDHGERHRVFPQGNLIMKQLQIVI